MTKNVRVIDAGTARTLSNNINGVVRRYEDAEAAEIMPLAMQRIFQAVKIGEKICYLSYDEKNVSEERVRALVTALEDMGYMVRYEYEEIERY